jgi:hypothetical protein
MPLFHGGRLIGQGLCDKEAGRNFM